MLLNKKKDPIKKVWAAKTLHAEKEGQSRSVPKTSSGIPMGEFPMSYLRGSGEPDSPQTGAYCLEALRRGIFHGDLPRVPHENTRQREMGSSKWLYLACLAFALLPCSLASVDAPKVPERPSRYVRITAYWKGQDYYTSLGLSSTGRRLVSGKSCAVDPKVFSYGTLLRIAGREFKAIDTGTAVVSRRAEWSKAKSKRLPVVDLFFDTEREARQALSAIPKYAEVQTIE